MSLPATEAFTGADNTTPPNANWTNQDRTIEIASNQANAYDAAGGNYASGTWNADTPNADQYAQLVFKRVTAEGGPILRASGSGALTSYYCLLGRNDLFRIYRIDNRGFTQLMDLGTSVANNDVAKLTIEGTTLKGYKNGVQQGSSATDSTYSAAGSFGLMGITNSTHGSGWLADDWEGGNMGGAALTVAQESGIFAQQLSSQMVGLVYQCAATVLRHARALGFAWRTSPAFGRLVAS